jgi:hypothetical protein
MNDTLEIYKDNLEEKDTIFFYNKYKNEYIDYDISPKYLAGMMDGDGSFSCAIKYPNYVKVEISQCDFLVIYLIQKKFPGLITKVVGNEQKRNQYKITYVNSSALPILEFIKEYLLLKKEQCMLCIENINTMRNIENVDILKENAENIIKLNKNHNEKTILDTINWEYIAGLFDAEGCVIASKCQVSITQKNSHELLEKIAKFIGYGKVRYPRYYIEKKSSVYHFFSEINKYLIVKKQYSYYLENLISSIKYDPEKDLYREKYKHNFNISNEFVKSLNVKKERSKYQDNKILRKTLSIKKMGENNPNFGKERSKEHSQKISKNSFGKKREISDEIIQEILDKKGSKTQEEIAKEYGISRASVYKIHIGKLVKTDEYEKYKENKENNNKKDWIQSFGYNKEETDKINIAIKKRTIDGKIMTYIWYYGKLRQQTISTPFKITCKNVCEYYKSKMSEEISENIVKNIWNNKTKLYKCDFENSPVSWQDYCENNIINGEWIEFPCLNAD